MNLLILLIISPECLLVALLGAWLLIWSACQLSWPAVGWLVWVNSSSWCTLVWACTKSFSGAGRQGTFSCCRRHLADRDKLRNESRRTANMLSTGISFSSYYLPVSLIKRIRKQSLFRASSCSNALTHAPLTSFWWTTNCLFSWSQSVSSSTSRNSSLNCCWSWMKSWTTWWKNWTCCNLTEPWWGCYCCKLFKSYCVL